MALNEHYFDESVGGKTYCKRLLIAPSDSDSTTITVINSNQPATYAGINMPPGALIYDIYNKNLYLAPKPCSSFTDIDGEGLLPIVHNKDNSDTRSIIDFLKDFADNGREISLDPSHHTISLALFKKAINELPEVYTTLPDSLPTEKESKYYVPSLSLFKDLNDKTITDKYVVNDFNGVPSSVTDDDAKKYVLSAKLGPDIKTLIENAKGYEIINDHTGTPKQADGSFYKDEKGNDKTDTDYALSAEEGKKIYDLAFSEGVLEGGKKSLFEEIKALKLQLGLINTNTSFETRLAALEAQNLAARVRNLESITVINGGVVGEN